MAADDPKLELIKLWARQGAREPSQEFSAFGWYMIPVRRAPLRFESALIQSTVGKAAVASALALAAFAPLTVPASAAPAGDRPAARESISGRVSAVRGNDVDIRD